MRLSLAALLLLSASVPLVSAEWQVEDHSPDHTLRAGQTLSLYCRVGGDNLFGNDDWKHCAWQRARDGAKCETTYECHGTFCITGGGEWSHRTVCDPALANAEFFGDDPNDRYAGVSTLQYIYPFRELTRSSEN